AAAAQQKRPERPEQRVAAGEAEGGVDVAEPIDAGEQERAGKPVPARARDLAADALLERGMVVEAGQRIARGETFEQRVLVPQLAQQAPVGPPQLESFRGAMKSRPEIGEIERLQYVVGHA